MNLLHQSLPAPGAPATLRVDALAAADHRGVLASPVSALVTLENDWAPLEFRSCGRAFGPAFERVIPRGRFTIRLLTPAAADADPALASARRVTLPNLVLLPGLINAHTHLDLTHVGPFEAGRGDFPSFLKHVLAHRAQEPDAIAASVRLGVELSLAGGVVAIGDIAGCPRSGPTPIPWRVLRDSALAGTSFLECFGIGPRAAPAVQRALEVLDTIAPESTPHQRVGLQPHAPYSVGLDAYRALLAHAAPRGIPVSTHLAESPAERQFIADGAGPHRGFLESLGLWSPDLLAQVGHGRTPVEHLYPLLSSRAPGRAPGPRPLLVHCNDVSDRDLELLAETGCPVAYCPRSSEYFAAEAAFGPHRYQAMRRAGIPVCLGTDSIINLPARAADPDSGGMTVLEEARRLLERDGADPAMLLEMMTTAPARALGLRAEEFEFGALGEARALRGLVGLELSSPGRNLGDWLRAGNRPQLLFLRNFSGPAETF